MNRFLKLLLTVAVAAPLLVSCNDNDNDDYAHYRGYVTLNVEGNSYYFTGDSGKTYYPGDVSRIRPYETEEENAEGEIVSKDGKRVFIYFNYLVEEKPGYDHNLAIYGIIDILSKPVEVATTEEEVEKVGDDKLEIADINLRGEWLDIVFSVMTDHNGKHKMTLLDNHTVQPPASMPTDYQYLEFRQEADISSEIGMRYGDVSFKLGAYHPSNGKKGLYIRINNLRGNIEYIKIPYEAQTLKESTGSNIKSPYEVKNWTK